MASPNDPRKEYATIGYEDVGGLDTQIPVSAATPLPVTVGGTVTVAEPVTVDGTVAVSSVAGTVATDPTDDPTRDLGKVDVASLDQYTPVGGRLPVDPSGVTSPVSIAATVAVDPTDDPTRDNGKVDVASLDQYTPVSGRLPVDGSGVTQPVSGTIIANAGTGTRDVGGDVAHDSPDGTTRPVKVGGKAAGALPTAVTADDRVNTYHDREGRLVVRPWGAGDWTQLHAPAANTRATATKAAGGGGVRHVCTGITVVLAAGATAPTAVNLQVRLRDGISDTGTILWESTISLPATAGVMNGISRTGMFIRGTAATAMTLEFSAAGGANTIESVSMEGVDLTEA